MGPQTGLNGQRTVICNGQSSFISGNGARVVSAGTTANGIIRRGGSPRRVEPIAGNRRIGIYEPLEGRIVTERIVTEPALEEIQIETPNVAVCERIEEVLHIHEQDIVVEVPEIHHHKSTIHMPKYTEELVDVPYEVTQLHVREEIDVVTELREEVTEIPVPVVTTREVEKPVLKTHVETDTVYRDFPVGIPSVEKVIQRPNIDVRANVHYVKGHTDIKVYEPEYFEELHTVQVPRVVPVPITDQRVEAREAVVEQIRRVERIVEIPEVKVIEVDVEIPQVHIEQTIIEQPRFVPSDVVLTEDTGEDYGYIRARDDLRLTRRRIEQVQLEKEELKIQLELMVRELQSARVVLEEERRRLDVQRVNKSDWEFGIASPSTVTTAGELGEFSPVSSASFATPTRRYASPGIHRAHSRPTTSRVTTAGELGGFSRGNSTIKLSPGSRNASPRALKAQTISRPPTSTVPAAAVSRSPTRQVIANTSSGVAYATGARAVSRSPTRQVIANTMPRGAYATGARAVSRSPTRQVMANTVLGGANATGARVHVRSQAAAVVN